MKSHARPAVERLLRLALHLAAGNAVSVAHIMSAHGVSLATAKRDMTMLESMLPVYQEPLERARGAGGPEPKALRMMRGGSAMLRLLRPEAA